MSIPRSASGQSNGGERIDSSAFLTAPKPSPPPTNRGVQTPEGDTLKKSGAIVDWLSFTLPSDVPHEFLEEWLQPGFVPCEKGFFGYTKSWRRGGIVIAREGNPGVHVSITGQGCRELERLGVVDSWLVFCADVLKEGGSVTRFDGAIDDYEGRLELEIVMEAAKSGTLCSRYRAPVAVQENHDIETGEVVGRSLTFGSKASDSKVRMYDKRLERMAHGEPDPGPWNRCEVQLRRGRAHKMVEYVAGLLNRASSRCETYGELLSGVIYGLIDVKHRGAELQRYKWATVEMWGSFLCWVEKQRLTIPPPIKSVDKAYKWLNRTASGALGLCFMARECQTEWVEELVLTGVDRAMKNPLYVAALRLYEAEGKKLGDALGRLGLAGGGGATLV